MELLVKIISQKQKELASLRIIKDFDLLMERAKKLQVPDILVKATPAAPLFIGEFKRFSPSRPQLAADKDPVEVALAYERSGFGAISVLTDILFFGAEPDDLSRVKRSVSLPILRKEFIVDPLQIPESKLMGADILLLISRILSKEQLKRYLSIAHEAGLQVFVETENEAEFEYALELAPDLIGVNNRDLSSLNIDLKKTERLLSKYSCDVPVIAESGIHSVEDAKMLLDFGVSGFLMGEYFLKQPLIEQAAVSFIESFKKEALC